ncbi:thermonuclease family protein [Cyanobacteria bacterium FACHB-63]|nr:thermonuclease family protein [Cyanobacteria bacterium FACHB-63]
MKKVLIATIALLLIGLPAVAQSRTSGKVVSVGDGDTVRVQQGNRTVTVRLACVDAPEMKQAPYGQQAANRLKQLLPQGKAVQLRSVTTDRYGRMVAEVYVDGQSINLTLVQEGQAVVYREYLNGCAETKSQYLQAENVAKQKKLGFWNQPNPVMPADFRAGRSKPSRSSSKPVQQPTSLPACVNSDCDCGDFSSWEEAQRVFQAFPNDPFGLDRDRDGVACESLRR